MFIMTEKQINARIASIGKVQAKHNQSIHELLCNITMHALAHNDPTAVDRLLDAVKGSHRKGIMKWCAEYSCVRFEKGKACMNKDRAKEMRDNVTLEELLAQIPWYEELPSTEQEGRSLSIEARLESLLKQALKANEDGKLEDAGHLVDVQNLLIKFKLQRELDQQEA